MLSNGQPPLTVKLTDIYAELKELQPKRPYDHHIPLKQGVNSVTLRPYRFPHVQKAEMEKMVGKMEPTVHSLHQFF